ncbi:hypothetical protein [Rhizobium sp. Leaf341]|uniref:hypothetical protein n=1 Tax=Rhizobium sp. Leaf341 TaxID=1736344 RepID=UPI000712D795|nr:hypothetical protein [Rhizobium sp. Leaf341]KQR77594.1 hypothetical protein ASG03_14395 [Rhizobium sp. Leaf341]
MSGRIKTAGQSAQRETARLKEAYLTLAADSCAPRDPRSQGEHYRRHLADAQRVIEKLQLKIGELEAERDRIRQRAEYDMSLCVTRSEAERERLGAFRLARGKAALLAEGEGGITTELSNAIEEIPDIKPKWI